MVGYQEGAILLLADDISILICRPGFTVSACAAFGPAYVEMSPSTTD